MRATIRTGGLQGLAQRLAARHLPAAEAEAAGRAARELAAEIAAETDAPATIAGSPRRPLVRVADPVLLARIRGALGRPGDPVLDRIRLAFARRRS